MNVDTAFEIVELGLMLARNQTSGKVQEGTIAADTLLQIIHKAVQAYEHHTGEPLDSSAIRAERPI
jgi:hypothetical protein